LFFRLVLKPQVIVFGFPVLFDRAGHFPEFSRFPNHIIGAQRPVLSPPPRIFRRPESTAGQNFLV
jgi:hypothetical protein